MKHLILFIILVSTPLLYSQYIDSSQYPPGISWKYIDIDKFRIVFPAEISDEGQKVANLLDYIYPKISSSEKKGKRVTIFLRNSGIFSNGYIQLAPQKGEFFSTPPQSGITGNIDWYPALALHEGKHVDQFDRLNSGFTKFGGAIFGDLGRGFLSFLSVPSWFWEGESVYAETIYSSGGRGRLPSFDIGIRSILLEGKRYKYLKSYLSSYKDHIPDIYRLGYFLTTYLKKNYSPETVENILAHSSAYSFYPLIFSRSLKKSTGMNVKKLYKNVMDDLYSRWGRRDSRVQLTEFNKINTAPKNGWTLYTSPKILKNGDIVSQKYGLSFPLTLIRLTPSGDEKKITGINTVDHINNSLSVNGNKAVWSEPVRDLRWGNRSFSEIIIYNISTGNKIRLTMKTMYFAPALSPDGAVIAVIEFTKLRKTKLVFINSSDGSIINAYNSPGNSFLFTPSWDSESKRITFIRMENGKKSIAVFNLTEKTFTDITPLSFNSYSTPVFCGENILYSSPYSGIDNIYAVDISSGKQFRITSSRFGAFFPSVSEDKRTLLYSEYNLNGMDIVTAPVTPDTWMPLSEVERDSLDYFKKDKDSIIENNITEKDQIPVNKYPVKKYSALKDLINIHSSVIIPDRTEPAFEIYSSNKLNNTFITAGLSFNMNENRGKFYTEAVYAGLFPVIKGGFSRKGRKINDPAELDWEETNATLFFLVPLDLSRGIFVRKLNIEAGMSFSDVSGSNENNGYKINSGNIISVSYGLKYSGFKHYSKRDLAPVTAQFLSIKYTYTPWNSYYRGNIFSFQGGLYFPGFFRHHSIRVGMSYERQNPLNYYYSSDINFSRGYRFIFSKNLLFSSIDYSFPIAYPDLIIGELCYLKRIKGTVFADLGKGYDENNSTLFNSAGLELKGDINLFSVPIDLDIGMRITYRFGDNSLRFDTLFLGINF